MGARTAGPDPATTATWGTPVAIPFGDVYLERLAREHRRLEWLLAETVHRLDDHQRLLSAGLTDRGVHRVDTGAFVIRRHGRHQVEIL